MYKDTFKMIDGDMVIEDGDFVLETGEDELRQNIENRYAINQGEWFLNIGLGLNYSEITGKQVSDNMIDLAIRECGLQDDRIKEVINVQVERENRKADITFDLISRDDNRISQGVVDID